MWRPMLCHGLFDLGGNGLPHAFVARSIACATKYSYLSIVPFIHIPTGQATPYEINLKVSPVGQTCGYVDKATSKPFIFNIQGGYRNESSCSCLQSKTDDDYFWGDRIDCCCDGDIVVNRPLS